MMLNGDDNKSNKNQTYHHHDDDNDNDNNTGFHYPRGHHLVNTTDENDDHHHHHHRVGGGGGGELELTTSTTNTTIETLDERERPFQDEYDDDDKNKYNEGKNHGHHHKQQQQHEEHDDNEDQHQQQQQQQQQYEHNIGSARTPWYGTTIVLLSEVMGTGILSLPYAAKTLGWVSAVIAVPTFCFFSCYSGWLLAHVRCEYPQFHSYADASTHLFGPKFGQFTKICMLLNWGACAIYYLIATADGLGDISFFANLTDCSYKRSIFAALLLVLPCQCRDFYSISKYLSIPSTLAIVFLVFIICGGLIFESVSSSTSSTFGATTTLGPHPDTDALDYLEALSAFVFAYQGQAIFLELMSEMKYATQFPKSCNIAYVVMCCMYGLTVIIAYGTKGVDTPEFLPDILPDEKIASTIVGMLVVMHISVSYVIACQPLHMWLHSTIFPKTYNEESLLGTIHWFILTFGYITFGYIIGNLIPFFADVQALIGSLFGAPTVFGWPPAFFMVTYRQKATSWREAIHMMGIGHATICLFFLFVCAPLFCILGTAGAIQSIIEDAEKSIRPFQCETT